MSKPTFNKDSDSTPDSKRLDDIFKNKTHPLGFPLFSEEICQSAEIVQRPSPYNLPWE